MYKHKYIGITENYLSTKTAYKLLSIIKCSRIFATISSSTTAFL